MVSYKRLTPEDVYFSSSVSCDEPIEDSSLACPPEQAGRSVCSSSWAFLSLGLLLLLVCVVWLLGTILWLQHPYQQDKLRPPAPAPPPSPTCASVPLAWRFDCYPERDVVVTRALCEQRNCCFLPDERETGPPWCFYPRDFPSYSLEALNHTQLGFTGRLTKQQPTYYPADILTLQLNVWFESNSRLRVRVTDPSAARFEVPISVPNVTQQASAPLYTVDFSTKPFGLVVSRTSTGSVLLNTTVAPFFYAHQFLQFSTSLPSRYLYGLGEHRSHFLHNVDWNVLTMWARDAAPMEQVNLYGVHPFYLCMEPEGSAHGVFLLNSNAMEVVLQPAPALTWRTIGGILDFYVFLGPDPDSVVQQYLQVVGSPAMPPFWALGFHLCRWGYQTSHNMWELVKAMRSYDMPQDVQWNDIDYMDRSLDFTLNPENFTSLPEVVKDLHSNGQRYVMILDPGISSEQKPGTYWPYDEGLKRDIFIKGSDGKVLIGKVWPGLTAFPDFSNPDTHEWWFENLQRFHERVPFDGLWIDMNEPSNFVDGSLNGCPSNELENPPYTPGVVGGVLRAKTLCLSAHQKASVHYNTHSLYGLQEAEASASALKRITGKRPFIISRSTFSSQGRYSGHWLGDNRSQWKDLYTSISGIMTFNLLGVPLVGADVCGFSGSTTEELCVRWMQLGAFYPFMRNHNSLHEQPQDPTAFSPQARKAMQDVLLLRMSLFPLLYTLFHHAHTSGHTVARPLLFQFPHDVQTYDIDRQFLWGAGLLVTPVLDPGVDYVVGYFPKGVWYDLHTGDALRTRGEKVKLAAPLDKINIHLLEGVIVPTQKPNTTLWVSTGQPLHLLCCLTDDGKAFGDLFWDDGESLDTYETNNYAYVKFHVAQNTMHSGVLHNNIEASYITVESVSFFGVKEEPSNVTVNSQDVPFSYRSNEVLTVTDLGLNLNRNFTISWL